MLSRNWLSLTGTALVTTAGLSLLFVFPLHLRRDADNPYSGIVVFLVLPAIFFIGLILIPIGIYLGKRRSPQGLAVTSLDRKVAIQRLAWFFGITTFLNVIVGTQVTYRAVKHMETPQFCGQSCHSMSPEFTTYLNAPHSELECVECHVAPGAAGWIASKTSGIRQLYETALNKYPRPIPSAMESNRLVPARETCENCHWKDQFSSVKLRVITNYAEDEQNTRTQTVLMMLVGGSKFAGIHGNHFGEGIHIRFAAADSKRQNIPWVEYQNTKTTEHESFVSEGTTPDSVKTLPVYEMQCVDCHNRATHIFESPSHGMDTAMVFGEIATGLPFIKKKGVELLNVPYKSKAEAAEQLPPALVSFYQHHYPDLYATRSQDIRQAVQAILAIYNRNVFPDLKVTWGTYPNNLGHTDFPGCFRCHDGSHTTSGGKTITQDCQACHQPLAMDEASPEILKTLGIEERILSIQKK